MIRITSTPKIILVNLFILTSSLIVSAQGKYHYLTVEFVNIPDIKDSIIYTIDFSGLDSIRKEKINAYTSKRIKFKTELELFNGLGQFGWELYMIDDSPNKLGVLISDYPRQFPDYYIAHDRRYGKKKVWFKLYEQ